MAETTEVLNLGTEFDNKTEWVSIDDNSRRANLAIYGIKNTGKAHTITPFLFRQDVQRKASGITFIVNTPQLAFELYTIGKHTKRKVQILKPSVNFAVLNKLLFAEKWSYELINNEIIDYKQAINDADIIIIDMEQEKYGMHAVKATAMLLMQLQTDMSEVEATNKRRHYVYVDDAAVFLPYMTNLLKYGEMFNISSTFFFNSRSEFIQDKDYTHMIDNNVRNFMLLQGINYTDAAYFASRLNLQPELSDEEKIQFLLNRQYGEFAYEILSPKTYVRKTGLGQLMELPAEERESIAINAKRHRKSLLKNMKEIIISKHMQMALEENKLQELNTELKVGKSSSMMEQLEDEVTRTIKDIDAQPLEEENNTEPSSKQPQVLEPKQDVGHTKQEVEELEPDLDESPVLTEPDFDNIDDSVLGNIEYPEIESELNKLDDPITSEDLNPINLLDEIDIPSITVPSNGPFEEEITKQAEAEPLKEFELGDKMEPAEFTQVDVPEYHEDIEVSEEKENFEFELKIEDPNKGKKPKYYPYQRIKNKNFENEMNKLFKL